MKKITLGIALLIACSTAMAGNDVWQTLFKEKLKEANQGNSNAQFDIGSMYQNGRGVTPDRTKAINWYRKAAAQQNDKAISRLKLLQANEERFRKESASASNGNPESQYKLGNMYTEGVGTNIDLKKAAEAYEQSANQGYVKAEYKLGLIYYEGTGVKASKKTAYKWFRKAADKNYAAAQYYLGKMFASGEGVKRNYNTSLEWYTKAVDGGFNQARSEMIDVTGKMKSAKNGKPAPSGKVAAMKSSPAKKQSPAAAADGPAGTGKEFGIEDLMVAAWSRDGEPVSYLPSVINNCRTEKGKIACYSDNQTRESAGNVIKFKTKAIMRDFSRDGSFQVSYRNLVTDSQKNSASQDNSNSDEIGGVDDSTESFAVQTGWGIEHVLECQMLEVSKVSCVKNKTHTFVLDSPQTVAAGN
jgi:TPR repeat protein